MTAPVSPVAALCGRLAAAPRLTLCAVIGLIIALSSDFGLPPVQRVALGWIIGVGLFLALTIFAVGHATPEQVRGRARREDESAWVIFFILLVAAMISLLALGFVPHKEGAAESAFAPVLRIGFAGLAVVASWTLAHTTFAFRYAHHYYGDPVAKTPDAVDRGGLAFPGDEQPDYWDFIYYSFVVGMTCQVSDVQVTSSAMRRLTLAHGVLAFLFNTVILALAVNLAAGAL